ncbi:MAG: hydrogenase, partial [Desulfobacter sp.]|nr:hydrogenase [Desulfobacter sp.]
MLSVLKNRFEQGYRTNRYPEEKVKVFPRYRGRPVIQDNISMATLETCAASCPQDAIDVQNQKIDMGRCIFCGTCENNSNGQIQFTNDYEISTSERADLITSGNLPALAEHAKQHFKKLFGRSLQLRQVSAAGCNACEADLNVLATP